MFVQIILLLVTAFIFYKLIKSEKPKNFPPGPNGLPIVGAAFYIKSLDSDPPIALKKLGEQFGPVCGLTLGKRRSIVVNGYEAVKEVLTRDEFVERPNLLISTYIWGGKMRGIFFGHGETWKEQRRFTLRNLRDFGFGKTSLEGIIHEEVADCIQHTKSQLKANQSVISLEGVFAIPVLNILWAVTNGKRISRDNPEMMTLLQKISDSFKNGSSTGSIVDEYPFLRHIPIVSKSFHIVIKGQRALHDILFKEIEDHEKQRDDAYSRDFTDVYLKQIEDEKQKGNLNSSFTKDEMVAVIADLFAAGAESTSNSVAFAIMYMILHPNIQEKVQKELDKVIGRERLPSVNDRANLPYTEAVLAEVLRVSSIAPIFPPHYNEKQAKLMGYDIPKGSLLLVNAYSVHMEKSYWGDPEQFRPERFLNDNGKFAKSERILSFGIGKRACIGEPLARMGYFDFFAAFMQNFKMEMVSEMKKPDTTPLPGFTISPRPFQARVSCR